MNSRTNPRIIDAFILGAAWPDWWAEAVSAGTVTTHNHDRRWRGGPDYALIETLDGTHKANKGDYILRGSHGEISSCTPAVFAATYDAVEAPPL